MSQHPALRYLRPQMPGKPHLWCPGCGTGQIWHYTTKAIDLLDLDPNQVLWVGGAGCSGRMCTYWGYDYAHTLHGRALAFATGVKVAKPELKVIVHMGDGDAAAIGGNHLIQTARRNVGLLAICINNFNYGMTGGQFSPTTPVGAKTQTSPWGGLERSFDLCRLVVASGASYVARCTTADPHSCIRMIKKGLAHSGFSFVEVVSQCPTQYGKNNGLGDGASMLHWLKTASVKASEVAEYSGDDLEGKLVVGEFVDKEQPEYADLLRGLAERSSRTE
jgi:2-oxoglutarate ferredoxin oxidoreductase subunit beta